MNDEHRPGRTGKQDIGPLWPSSTALALVQKEDALSIFLEQMSLSQKLQDLAGMWFLETGIFNANQTLFNQEAKYIMT